MVLGGCSSMKCMVVVMLVGFCRLFILILGKWLSRNGVCMLLVIMVEILMLSGCSLVCSVCDNFSSFYLVVW